MNNSKLIRLIQHFSKTELNQLKTFINSPFFNKNKNVQKLMAFIELYAPCYNDQLFTYENAFAFIFQGQTFRKETIIKLFSKLLILTEQFIIHSRLKENDLMGKIELLKYYNHQNFTGYFQSTLKKTRQMQSALPIKNDDWIYRQLLIEHEYAFFLSLNSDDGTGDVNLQITNDSLDKFYVQRKLRYFCFMKNRERSVNHLFTYSLEKELAGFLKNSPFWNEPSVVIWRDAYLLLCNQNSLEHYQQLKSNLDKYASEISLADKRTLYTYLENTTKFVFVDFFEELYALYKLQIDQEIIYKNNYLIPVVFKNIVTVALRLKKFKWAENFIKTHRNKIFPEHKEKDDIYFLCLALLHFEQGAFENALDVLNQTKMTNLYIKLEERRLRLKIYYEMDFLMLFEDNINSFRKFLSEHRSEIVKYYLEANRNFINILNYLSKTTRYDDRRKIKLSNMVSGTVVLPEEIWIREKIKSIFN